MQYNAVPRTNLHIVRPGKNTVAQASSYVCTCAFWRAWYCLDTMREITCNQLIKEVGTNFIVAIALTLAHSFLLYGVQDYIVKALFNCDVNSSCLSKMGDWVFCNHCCQRPSESVRVELNSCGHLVCAACKNKGKKVHRIPAIPLSLLDGHYCFALNFQPLEATVLCAKPTAVACNCPTRLVQRLHVKLNNVLYAFKASFHALWWL